MEQLKADSRLRAYGGEWKIRPGYVQVITRDPEGKRHEHYVTATPAALDAALRALKGHGHTAVCINGSPGWDIDEVEKKIEELTKRGCRFLRTFVDEYECWAPWALRWSTVTPQRIEDARRHRKGNR